MKFLKEKRFLTIIFSILVSLFIVCFVEKFVYSNEPFLFKRAIIGLVVYQFFIYFALNLIVRFYKNKNWKEIFKLKNIYYLKYVFSFFALLYCSFFYKNITFIYFGLCELAIISLVTDLICKKNRTIASIFNISVLILFNTNLLIYLFSSSFLSMIMIHNLGEINRISGNAFVYVSAVSLMLIFTSVIPYKKNESTKNRVLLLIYTVIIEILLLLSYGGKTSVSYNYVKLTNDYIKYNKFQGKIKKNLFYKREFYKDGIDNYVTYNGELGNKPNVILIFTEGLSNHIIYDERNIMPNLRNFSNKTISFTNYYNHTAATYRGILGQLFSGYQNNNLDRTDLIGIHDVLKENGYYTTFINVEPGNDEFTYFVNDLHFDKVVNDKIILDADVIHDKEAYEELFDTAIELNKKDQPFFAAIYTFDTHVTFDSSDVKYKNGKNKVLNRFYNVDYQFDKFIDKFNNSPLYDNTIVIFTADHSSYTDNDYLRTFNGKYAQERVHNFVDEIPLYIYHKNVKPQKIDVNGRNSINIAPTILDYIDISGKNYFLGTSLFASESKSRYETLYAEGLIYFDTKNDKVVRAEDEEEINNFLTKYYSAAKP